MDRLTSHKSKCNVEMICRNEDCFTDEEHCPHLNVDNCRCFQNILKKLAEYEDLEEQGKILKLPCKVGDTVYVIPSEVNYRLNIANGMKKHNRVYEQPVSRIEFLPGGYVLSTCDGMDRVSDRFFNITWFLTKKEAEEALKKMERDVDGRYHTV